MENLLKYDGGIVHHRKYKKVALKLTVHSCWNKMRFRIKELRLFKVDLFFSTTSTMLKYCAQ